MSTHEDVIEWLEERQGRFIRIADQIWEHPELALAEHVACGLQADDLAADGFTITRHVGNLPTTCFALGVPGHSWANTATGGVAIGHKGMLHAAKGMAITASRLIADPALLQEAKAEFAEATRGRPYQCPIPPHVQPRRP
jgi:metal-dependent amidase/aminoacylase/carboxypeptidase family protein